MHSAALASGSACFRLESFLLEQARVRPDQIAIDAPTGALTFAALRDASETVAHALRLGGIRDGDRVLVQGEPSRDLPAAVLGILLAGASCVPIDPQLPVARIRRIAATAGAAGIIETDDGRPLDDTGECPRFRLSTLLAHRADGGAGSTHLADGRSDVGRRSPDATAFVFFTSGSTGGPKGVLLSHRSLISRQLAEQRLIPLASGDRMLFRTSIAFDVLIREVFWPIMAGCTIVAAPLGGTRDARTIAATIAERDVTVAAFSPTLLRLVLQAPESDRCSTLRHALSGGESLTKELHDEFHARFPGATLYNFYGPTEAFTATFWRCRRDWTEDVIPIGHPTDLDVYVVDQHGEPVRQGEIGEIWIGGSGVADGYLGAPAEAALKFGTDPFASVAQPLFRTGDLARRRADGALVFEGRRDTQVKLHGQRVELGEVERALRGCPGVLDAAATVRHDVGPLPLLVAYIVTEPARDQPDLADLRAALAQELPRHMVPALMVPIGSLPIGTTGKLDRDRLPPPAAAPSQPGPSPASPSNGVEREVLLAVRRVAADPSATLDDDLLAMAVDSLGLMELLAELEERTRARLTLTDLIEARSIRVICATVLARLADGR